MADVFISHSQVDLPLAEFLHRHLKQEGLEVYLASVSMQPAQSLYVGLITACYLDYENTRQKLRKKYERRM